MRWRGSTVSQWEAPQPHAIANRNTDPKTERNGNGKWHLAIDQWEAALPRPGANGKPGPTHSPALPVPFPWRPQPPAPAPPPPACNQSQACIKQPHPPPSPGSSAPSPPPRNRKFNLTPEVEAGQEVPPSAASPLCSLLPPTAAGAVPG